MFEKIKQAFVQHALPRLPESIQRVFRGAKNVRNLPGDLIQDGQDEFEQMLNASPLGQAALEELLKNKKKHIGHINRGSSIIVEISDERQDDLTLVRPDEVRALAATHLTQSVSLPGKLRIRFTPKPPQC